MKKKEVVSKNTKGGFREGAGRKQIYGEKTTILRFVVPISKEAEFVSYCREKLDTWLVEQKQMNVFNVLDDEIEYTSELEKILPIAKQKYPQGTSVFYNEEKLSVAFGMTIENNTKTITVGCFDAKGIYTKNIPIYTNGEWAKKASVK